MAIVKGDLTPILSSSPARIDATQEAIFLNEQLVNAIDSLARLSIQSRRHVKNSPGNGGSVSLAHESQPLPSSCSRLQHSDNILYLSWEYDEERNESCLQALLRVCRKRLYLHDRHWLPYEGRFVCVLDFYVHFSVQRHGIGKRLLDYALESERVGDACQLAFDEPSVALLRFLAKKCGLEEPIWQNTNFVVFPQLFQSVEKLNVGNEIPPEGWRRPTTPRHIGGGAVDGATRFLDRAISGHSAAARRARTNLSSTADRGGFADGNADEAAAAAAQMQNEARQRKQQILSNRPLW